MASSPPPTGAEISEALNTLEEEKGWAVAVRDELTQQIRWTITDAGRAQLAKKRNL
ncbi:MAG: hypothetical protein KIT22_07795 [Verrucomicrobiae bacterium]|nr:hypothetical protein [Verrucomicrobiae bacterium]